MVEVELKVAKKKTIIVVDEDGERETYSYDLVGKGMVVTVRPDKQMDWLKQGNVVILADKVTQTKLGPGKVPIKSK